MLHAKVRAPHQGEGGRAGAHLGLPHAGVALKLRGGHDDAAQALALCLLLALRAVAGLRGGKAQGRAQALLQAREAPQRL